MADTSLISASPQAEAITPVAARIDLPFFGVRERRWLLALVDAGVTVFWLLAGYELWRAWAHPGPHNMASVPWRWIVVGSVVWLAISWLAGAYELDTADRFLAATRTTATITFVAAPLAFAAYYVFPKTYPRPGFLLVLACVPATVVAWRLFYAGALRRPAHATRLLVLGDASKCSALLEAARRRPDYYQVVGFLWHDSGGSLLCLGMPADLERVVETHRVHRIVVSSSESNLERMVSPLFSCVERGLDVVGFDSTYEEIAEKVAVDQVQGAWLAALPTSTSISSLQTAAIRGLDIAGAVLGLGLMVMLWPVIGVAIAIESGKPTIYRQQRVGRSGRPFTMYKFRSMRHDAEAAGARWAQRRDNRVTRVGSYLRKTHLDELPQFWNVLRGDMSLVGPRPERPVFVNELARQLPFYRLRLTVRPGMTGLKQIKVGYAASEEEHLEVLKHDLYYIKHRSVLLNLLIMARTVGSILTMEGR